MKIRLLLMLFILFCAPLAAQNPLPEMQELYNGSIWIDYLSVLKGDQFLFNPVFRPGSVTLRGKTFRAELRYDIYEDQLQIPAGRFGILQINKELIDSFSIREADTELKFIHLRDKGSKTFYHVLYKGGVSLYATYAKKIDKLNTGSDFAGFYQITRIFLIKNNDLIPVNSRKDLLIAMNDRKTEMHAYMRKNRTGISLSSPESFVPAVKVYDSLTR